MAIFNGDLFNDVPVYEGYGVNASGNIMAVIESFDDDIAIIEAMHKLDMDELHYKAKIKALRESGADTEEIEELENEMDEVTEANSTSVFGRIREALAKLWGKIKDFFKSIIRFFDGLAMSGKDFAKKYKTDLLKLDLRGYEHKMYNYTIDKANIQVRENDLYSEEALKNSVTEILGKNKKDIKLPTPEEDEKSEDATRGEYVGKSACSSDNYAQELFSYFRDGALDESFKRFIPVSITSVISFLETNKDLDNIKKAETAANKEFANLDSTMKNIESTLRSKETDTDAEGRVIQAANYALRSAKKHVTIYTTFLNAYRSACEERLGEYKKICVNAFRYKPEK